MVQSKLKKKKSFQYSSSSIALFVIMIALLAVGCSLGPKGKIKRGANDIEKIIIKFDSKIIEFEDEKIARDKLEDLALVAYNKIGFIINDIEGYINAQPLKKKDQVRAFYVETFEDLNQRMHSDYSVAMSELKIESFNVFVE